MTPHSTSYFINVNWQIAAKISIFFSFLHKQILFYIFLRNIYFTVSNQNANKPKKKTISKMQTKIGPNGTVENYLWRTKWEQIFLLLLYFNFLDMFVGLLGYG